MGNLPFGVISQHAYEALKSMQDAGYVLVRIGFTYIGAFNAFSMEAIYRKPGVPRPWTPGYIILSGASTTPWNTTAGTGW
jgi:hypothetical protein